MIRLTERAAHGLREILTAQRLPRDKAVKLVPGEDGIAMVIDSAHEGDAVVDGGRRPLLIVDAAIAPRLDGTVLDLSPGAENEGLAPRFVLRDEHPPVE